MRVASRKDQTLAVFGLGASGAAAAAALMEGGARVLAWDDSARARDAAAAAGIPLLDPAGWDWPGLAALVLSPGIPLHYPAPHPAAAAARKAGRPIVGDVELLAEAAPGATLVGITGTNGKSTTTALLGHVLGSAGRPAAAGGNLGPPALSLPALGEGGVYALELSSYQLDLVDRARFDVAALLNVSIDHIDRHGGVEGYVAAKRRIFRDRADGAAQTAVLGIDDRIADGMMIELSGRPGWRTVPVAVGRRMRSGFCAVEGRLFERGEPITDLAGIESLPGAHNHQNAAVAAAAARTLGVDAPTVARALRSFPGLPHRQELVARIGEVAYVNDSKATNGEAALRAICSYDRIYWIAGGVAKADGLGPVLPELHRVRRAYLIGEAEEGFADEIGGRVPARRCGGLDRALEAAHADAQADGAPGATVLLSPACASFDQFPSFAARGDAFRDRVRRLAGTRRCGG